MYNKAFTLAEVLVTFAIIGIVASLTIPGIISNYNDMVFKKGLKKNFSILSKATNLVKSDNMDSLIGLFHSNVDVREKFGGYLATARVCPSASFDGCWHRAGEWTRMDGVSQPDQWRSGFILADGTLVVIAPPGGVYGNCSKNNICLTSYIDVNGFKGPNMVGKDIFGLNIYEGPNKAPVIPSLWGTCDSTGGSGSGRLCALLYLQE